MNTNYDTTAHDEDPSDGNTTWKQHSEAAQGGIRRVDSLDLARMRLPECHARKSRKSNLSRGDGAKKGDKSPRALKTSSVSVEGIVNITGLGSSSSQMVKA